MLMTGAPAWLGAELASTVGIFSLCAHLNLWWNGRKRRRRKRVLDAYRKWNSLCIDKRRTLQIAWRVSSSSWLLPATFNNSWSTTQNIGAFQTKSTHIRQGLGRGGTRKVTTLFFYDGGQEGASKHTQLLQTLQKIQKSASLFIPISASCRIFFNWFHNKWAKAGVEPILLPNRSTSRRGERIESLTDPDSEKKRKDRLTDVTKHASI
jgi:hypothetical protein